MVKTPGKGNDGGSSTTPTNPNAPSEVVAPPAFSSPGDLPAGFEINTEQLVKVADLIFLARDRVDGVGGNMENTILTRDGFWGRDEIGKSIDASYPQQRDPIFEGMAYVSAILDAMAAGLVVVADEFAELDRQGKEAINKLRV